MQNHSTADLYYDATNQTLGSAPQSPYFTMRYAAKSKWGLYYLFFSFEVWLHHGKNYHVGQWM